MLKKALARLSGNEVVQKFLEKNVLISQYLMGIGSGADVDSSGEETLFRLLKERFTPPYCVFDIGANQGQFLKLVLAHLRIEDVRVHCFEPGSGTFRILTQSAPADTPNVTLNNLGVGKETGEAVLHYNAVGSGLASLTKRKLDHFGIDFGTSETVQITTIDAYCSHHQIDHIHLLKIDIEGHEFDALAGARRMFEAKAVDIVMFEFGGCNIDTKTFFQDYWYFFTNMGKRLYRITPSGYLSQIPSYDEFHEQFRTTNFIAL